MTEDQALEVAKANHKAHVAADILYLFHRGPKFDAFASYGYRNGWYIVGDYSFCVEDVTGDRYDPDQGGWAHV